MIVNFVTESDEDAVVAFALRAPVDAYAADTVYVAGDLAAYGGKIWQALGTFSGIIPGVDPAKWQVAAAPAARDLTGCALTMMARAPASAAYAPIAVSTDDGNIEITDAAAAEFTLKLPYAQLSRLPPGDYTHSLICITSEGERDLVWHGTLTHSVGPTR